MHQIFWINKIQNFPICKLSTLWALEHIWDMDFEHFSSKLISHSSLSQLKHYNENYRAKSYHQTESYKSWLEICLLYAKDLQNPSRLSLCLHPCVTSRLI